MKKIMLYFSIMALLFLAACGGTETSETSSTDAGSENQTQPTDGAENNPEREQSQIMQLFIGTLMLEDTEYALNANQAAELLPLWKLAKSLTISDTTAREELQVVVDQIADAMTEEQTIAMAEIDSSQENVFALFEELGISLFPEGFEGGEGQGGGFAGVPPAGITRPGGEGGQGSGGFAGGLPGGGQLSPEQQATADAMREKRGGAGFRVNPAMFDAVIQLLESKLD